MDIFITGIAMFLILYWLFEDAPASTNEIIIVCLFLDFVFMLVAQIVRWIL